MREEADRTEDMVQLGEQFAQLGQAHAMETLTQSAMDSEGYTEEIPPELIEETAEIPAEENLS